MNETTNSITFTYSSMNAVQLAHLYKLLIRFHRIDEANDVLQAGIANCGIEEFAMEIAKAS